MRIITSTFFSNVKHVIHQNWIYNRTKREYIFKTILSRQWSSFYNENKEIINVFMIIETNPK